VIPVPPAKSVLINKLTTVVIDRGYEGATLTHLARATGLSKASLYHHFPGGKGEMTTLLVQHTINHLDQMVFRHLQQDKRPGECLINMINGFSDYTQAGQSGCLLAVLSQHPVAHEAVGNARQVLIKTQFQTWQQALSDCFKKAGLRPKKAARAADEVLNTLYGALQVARLRQQPEVFTTATKRLNKRISRDYFKA